MACQDVTQPMREHSDARWDRVEIRAAMDIAGLEM
jgi:hypothetical protein